MFPQTPHIECVAQLERRSVAERRVAVTNRCAQSSSTTVRSSSRSAPTRCRAPARCSSRSTRPVSTAPTSYSARGRYPAPPGRARRTSRAWSSPARCVARGPGATRFHVGDRVMGDRRRRGQAELAVVHERMLMPVPEQARLGRGRRRPGGLHDRARRALHARRGCSRASGCSSTAPPAGSAPRRCSSAAPRAPA